ncbi:MAG: nuclear transport factor 2 family protein [Planctomycetes bacterium]|nr:nuclear transport factor 2 family protein [Planctomycetota bacterium]
MKKSVILNLIVLVFVAVFCGCQAPVKGPSDKELINTTMTEWKAALEAKNLYRLMAVFSDNYVSSSGSGKVAMRERMAGAIERGSLDNVNIKIENAQLTIVGEQATFGPVEFTSDRGTLTIEYTLQREEDKWLIVGSKRQENSFRVQPLNYAGL